MFVGTPSCGVWGPWELQHELVIIATLQQSYFFSLSTMAQPDMQLLNQSALSFTNELSKFSNIPALAQGNGILAAINDLGNRFNDLGNQFNNFDNRFDQLVTRIQSAYVPLLISYYFALLIMACRYFK
jgi:hypothetical protein